LLYISVHRKFKTGELINAIRTTEYSIPCLLLHLLNWSLKAIRKKFKNVFENRATKPLITVPIMKGYNQKFFNKKFRNIKILSPENSCWVVIFNFVADANSI